MYHSLMRQFTWGCLVIGYVGVTNEKGLIALRFVLGVVEAGEYHTLSSMIQADKDSRVFVRSGFWQRIQNAYIRIAPVFYST